MRLYRKLPYFEAVFFEVSFVEVVFYLKKPELIAPVGHADLHFPQRIQSIESGFSHMRILRLHEFLHSSHFMHFSEEIVYL